MNLEENEAIVDCLMAESEKCIKWWKLTSCDEHKVAALHQTHDLAATLLCSLATIVRDATRTQASSHLFANV